MKAKRIISILSAAVMAMSVSAPAMAAKLSISQVEKSYSFNDGLTTNWSGNGISNESGRIKTITDAALQAFDIPNYTSGKVVATFDVDLSNITANDATDGAMSFAWRDSSGNMTGAQLKLFLSQDGTALYPVEWDSPTNEAYTNVILPKALTVKTAIDLDNGEYTMEFYDNQGTLKYTYPYHTYTGDLAEFAMYTRGTGYTLLDDFEIKSESTVSVPDNNTRVPSFYSVSDTFDNGNTTGWDCNSADDTTDNKLKLTGTGSGDRWNYRNIETLTTGVYRTSVDVDFSQANPGANDFGNLGWGETVSNSLRSCFKFSKDGTNFACKWINSTGSASVNVLSGLEYDSGVYTFGFVIDLDNDKITATVSKGGNQIYTSGQDTFSGNLTRFTVDVRKSTLILDNLILTGAPDMPSSIILDETFDSGTAGWGGSGVTNEGGKIKTATHYSFQHYSVPDVTSGEVTATFDIDLGNITANHETEGAVNLVWGNSAENVQGAAGLHLLLSDDGTEVYPKNWGNPDWSAYASQTFSKSEVITVKNVINLDTGAVTISLVKADGTVVFTKDRTGYSGALGHFNMYTRGTGYALLDNFKIVATGGPVVQSVVYNSAEGATDLSDNSEIEVSPYAENVVIEFNGNISGYNIDDYVAVKDADGNILDKGITLNGNEITLALNKVLETNKTYTVEISDELYGANGAQTGVAEAYRFKAVSSAPVAEINSVAKADDTEITTISALKAASEVKLNCTIKNAKGEAGEYAVIIAYCDANGTVVDVDIRDFTIDAGCVEAEIVSTGAMQGASSDVVSAKIFVWSDFQNFVPISDGLLIN